MLNANVGFLAVNKGGKTSIQMASYMSLVTSFASIVLGLFFVSQNRTSGQYTATEIVSDSCCISTLFLIVVGSGLVSR